MPKAKVITDYRLVSFLIAIVAALALTLSGCATTSAKSNHDDSDEGEVVQIDPGASTDEPESTPDEPELTPSEAAEKSPAKKSARDKHFGSMEIGESIDGNTPDGRTLQGVAQARGGNYSYGNRARSTNEKHTSTDAYDCIDLGDLTNSGDWATNKSILEDIGYSVEAICELSLDQIENTLAYQSELFDNIDTSDDYRMRSYGGTIYNVSDAGGLYYYVFVPSYALVSDYGQDGVFTSDYIYVYQQDPDGGPVELYYNLLPDEARSAIHPDAG